MAAMEITDAQRELINSLTADELPMKLRCAVCSKLALNAFRLPCCEQAICETCQSTLPTSCPICEHSPLAADDCSPHKSLRTTIRVFLRTAEKKREAAKPKEVQERAPEPALPAEVPAPTPAHAEPNTVGTNQSDTKVDNQEETLHQPITGLPQGAGGPSTSANNEQNDNDSAPQTAPDVSVTLDHDTNPQDLEKRDNQNEQTQEDDIEEAQDQEYQVGGDMNGFQNNNFSGGMGDYNQMQMMMAMQNGMGFPMMGMNAMDPMSMQQMYMNGGFQGMGMNGMGGFGGGFGQGSNDWNGAQSWNFDQNNYNQSGDFGNMNPGFQSGFNQGGYGNHYNSYGRGFGRGRGRGRGFYGGYGRGGYNYGNRMNYQQDQYGMNQPQAQGVNNQAQQGVGKDVDEFGRSLSQAAGEGGEIQDITGDATETQAQKPQGEAPPGDVAHTTPQGPGTIQSVLSVSHAAEAPLNAPTGPKAMRQGLPNTSLHHLRARGFQVGDASNSEPQQEAVPSAEHDRSRSGSTRRHGDRDGDHHSRSRSRDRGSKRRADSIDRSREEASRTRSRSPSRASSRDSERNRRRGQKSSHTQRRDVEDGDYDTEDYHRRKKHRSSRKRSSRYEEEDEYSGSREDRYADRSRSASPADSRRSGHRSRRDKDYDKRREHDDEDRQKSGHRSHRHRDDDSRRRHRDGDRDRKSHSNSQRDRSDREREDRRRERKERHRERDRDHKHSGSSSRKHSVDEQSTPAEQPTMDKASRPPTGPRGFDIKGSASASRRAAADDASGGPSSAADIPTASLDRKGSSSDMTSAFPNRGAKDPHAIEREARNRERLLRETMRMALAGTKRGRDGKDDGSAAAGDEARRRRGRRTEAEAE